MIIIEKNEILIDRIPKSIILKTTTQISVINRLEAEIMEKKKRTFYEVDWCTIEEWDEDGYPTMGCTNPSIEIDGVDYSGEFYTTNILKAGERFDFISEIIDGSGGEINEEVTLSKREVLLGDEEWKKLVNKEVLDYDDIKKLKVLSSDLIAMEFQTEITRDSSGFYFGEILRAESQYYNMKAICEKAGINYSTYKGFKNNNQYFSLDKILSLLKCMHDTGMNCWNDKMQQYY